MSDLIAQSDENEAKPRELKRPDNAIRRKLRAALDAMVWDGLEYAEAAKTVNFSVAAMRRALQRPHVLAYLRNERQVFRASLAPRNIHRLREIRDADNNQPAVNAIRLLEQIDEAEANKQQTNTVPHVTVRIVNATAAFSSGKPQPQSISDMSPSSPDAVTIPADTDAGRRGEK